MNANHLHTCTWKFLVICKHCASEWWMQPFTYPSGGRKCPPPPQHRQKTGWPLKRSSMMDWIQGFLLWHGTFQYFATMQNSPLLHHYTILTKCVLGTLLHRLWRSCTENLILDSRGIVIIYRCCNKHKDNIIFICMKDWWGYEAVTSPSSSLSPRKAVAAAGHFSQCSVTPAHASFYH